jgi:hypothetical protein
MSSTFAYVAAPDMVQILVGQFTSDIKIAQDALDRINSGEPLACFSLYDDAQTITVGCNNCGRAIEFNVQIWKIPFAKDSTCRQCGMSPEQQAIRDRKDAREVRMRDVRTMALMAEKYPTLPSVLIKFRPRRSTLEEELALTCDVFPTAESIMDVYQDFDLFYVNQLGKTITTELAGYDDRTDWNTYTVLADGVPLGFTNGPIDA